jgi:tRNA threonylcarbamoyl adenosine modification protein YeaZ
MIVFALDTASARPSFAFYDRENDNLLADGMLSSGRGQSNNLLPSIEQAMEDSGIDFSDISIVAGVTGPGSFTGIRVGLSFIKGVALALDVPCLGMSGFELFSKVYADEQADVLIGLESGRDEKFFQISRGGELLNTPINCTYDDLSEIIKVKDCAVFFDFDLERADGQRMLSFERSTAHMLAKIIDFDSQGLQTVTPYYIRNADTSTPKKI